MELLDDGTTVGDFNLCHKRAAETRIRHGRPGTRHDYLFNDELGAVVRFHAGRLLAVGRRDKNAEAFVVLSPVGQMD
ncbi:hypothetical protein AOZ07_11550 [Glutamicibacter halophytocola]|uniref:hypothetical protein n=1 Tax=Glutamicibacter halophytocola TaxID=1933880 RepID=UPI0006D4BF4A|nr:hypothetical protein [Glutamicibacter halophytocola]ALG29552.1 hypothetical protein AOZ07_11550 [Glutamicibacter halophytocola]